MKIKILASDSMGTRSMATYVETSDVKFFIDPGVALGPRRYGLPPHKLEIERMKEHWKKIVKYAKKAEIIAVTHYHYDHHKPNDDLEIYDDKIVFLKHPTENINKSQKARAAYFIDQIKDRVKEIVYSDGKSVEFGDTRITFSPPVCHGTNPRLGYVTEIFVDDGNNSFLHTSDVEGPSLKEQVDFILESCPKVVFVDGPMTYMLGYRYSAESLEKSLENLSRVLENCGSVLVLDHHLLRDLNWKEKVSPLFSEGKVLCAAEFMGEKPDLLEARRKELWGKLKSS